MSLRTKQTINVNTGAAPTFTAVTASDTVPVGDRLFAVLRSTHTTTIGAVVTVPGDLATGDAYPDKTYTIGIGSVTMAEVWIPLIKTYQDPTTGVATIVCTPTTTVTLAVVER